MGSFSGSASGISAIPNSIEKMIFSVRGLSITGTGSIGIKFYENIAGTPTLVSTGYKGTAIEISTGAKRSVTTAFPITSNVPAGALLDGVLIFSKSDINTDEWCMSGSLNDSVNNEVYNCAGYLSMSNKISGFVVTNLDANTFDGGNAVLEFTRFK